MWFVNYHFKVNDMLTRPEGGQRSVPLGMVEQNVQTLFCVSWRT
jgi:hypothetical protein